jgi:hypothetical protein
MRRVAVVSAAAIVFTLLVPAAFAKFGISKTRVTLPRTRPPVIHLLGDTVTVEVTTESRRVTDRQLRIVQDRVEQALSANKELHLVGAAERPENVVRVIVDDLEARIRESVVYEDKYVKIGERQEWDAKKNKYVTKDVYGNRKEPVTVRTVSGSLGAHVEAETPGGSRRADAGARYDQEFKGNATTPPEAYSEEALERFLVEDAADRAAAAVSYSPDPVDALLAVDGELKAGNRLAEAGMFQEALAEWGKRAFKGDKEAARLHNMGVAHEALAYRHPPYSPEHSEGLERAADHYRRALALDPQEKYFGEPTERAAVSLGFAENARAFHAATAAHRETRQARKRAEEEAEAAREAAEREAARKRAAITPTPVRSTKPAPPRPPVVKTPPPAPPTTGLSASAEVAQPLRNGSFEAALEPWTVTGRGVMDAEAGRGRVLRLSAETAAAAASQAVRLRPAQSGLGLALEYKVLEGAARVRILLQYEDAGGRPRSASLDVSKADAPGAWTAWSADLATVKPPLAQLTSLQIVVDGATVLLDNVSLAPR